MTGSERIGHYELYVFDWDGTVMDTTALIARGMQEAAKALLLPIPDYDVCRGTIGLSNPQAMAVVRRRCLSRDGTNFGGLTAIGIWCAKPKSCFFPICRNFLTL